ncbi:MAG: S9 family peptidase [Chloroflexi bacterium]|nr:S9 family peptidase [Chloroflexota bacterium]
MSSRLHKCLLALPILLMTACASAQGFSGPESEPIVVAEASPLATAVAIIDLTTVATAETQPGPSLTPTPNPATETPSPSVTPTPTPIPTATPTPPHELSIQYLRQQEYPGEGLTIERELEPGTNYSRYIASYLSEGNKNFALITVPRAEKPESGWPVIIFNHGYIPPTQYRTTERYVAYVHGFARNGYIVFRPDYRGHGDSEGDPQGTYGHPGYTIDVLNALAAMKQYPDADAERLGMWGHSMGGWITLRSMLVDDAIKAGVIWAGVVGSYADIVFNWHRDGQFPIPASIPERALRWRNDLIETHGTAEENPEFWDSISANAMLDELSGPVQLHHGTNDKDVPLDFSATLAEQIQAAGGTAEYYEYPGDNHNISNSFNTAMRESVRFFDEYLKGEGQ